MDVYVKTRCGLYGKACLTSGANRPLTEFKYLPKPTVTGIRPVNGPASAEPAGGRQVTISGTGFTTARSVKFGAVAAPDFYIASDTSIVATQPASSEADITAQEVDITVTTACGLQEGHTWPNATSCLTSETNAHSDFTFLPKPTITEISPATGLTTGNTRVTISGTGFITATDVDFGTEDALDFSVDSDTQISALVPAGSGKVEVAVTTACGLDQGSEWAEATSCLTSEQSTGSGLTYVSVLALNGAAPGSLTLNGGAKLATTTGKVVVDSSDDRAIIANGGSGLAALETWVVGGYRLTGRSSISPAPVTGSAPMADPFASVGTPSERGMTVQDTNLVLTQDATLQPGIYRGGITIRSNAEVTLAPGSYLLQGGGLTLEDQSSVAGQDVVVSLETGATPCGSLKVVGGSKLTLRAAAPASTNPHGGIVIYTDRECGTIDAQVTGVASSATLGGALYIPRGELSLSGGASITAGAVVADTITVNQGATLRAE